MLNLTLREEHRLSVFENRMLRRIFGPKREAGENCMMTRFIICILYQYYSTQPPIQWVPEALSLVGKAAGA